MKIEGFMRFTLVTVGVLSLGLMAAGGYRYLDGKLPDKQGYSLAKDGEGTRAAGHHLASDIERINTEIAALRNTSSKGPRGEMERRVTELHGDMQSLRDQLKALSDNVSLQQAVKDVPTSESSDATLTEEESEQRLRAQVEEQLAYIEEAATVEGTDPQWAETAMTDVLESFQSLSEEGVGVSDVRCHASFCQARFRLDDENVTATLQKLQTVSPWKGETFVWIEDVEQGEGVIYLAREGYELPHDSNASDPVM